MDSQNIDELVNLISINSELDSDTIRSCILSELENIDSVYQNDYLSGMTSRVINQSGQRITTIEDVIQMSNSIKEERNILSSEEVRRNQEEIVAKKKEENEAVIDEIIEKANPQSNKSEEKAINNKEHINAIDALEEYSGIFEPLIYGSSEMFKELEEEFEYVMSAVPDEQWEMLGRDFESEIFELDEYGLFNYQKDLLEEENEEENSKNETENPLKKPNEKTKYSQATGPKLKKYIITTSVEGKCVKEAIKYMVNAKHISEEEAKKLIATGMVVENLISYYLTLDESKATITEKIVALLEELYIKEGKKPDDLKRDLEERKKDYKEGRSNGRVAQEENKRLAKGYIEDYENGVSVDTIIEAQKEFNDNKTKLYSSMTELEALRSKLAKEGKSKDEIDEIIGEKTKEILEEYKRNISLSKSQYQKHIAELKKELEKCTDEAKIKEINSQIKKYTGRSEKLDNIEPTHRISMLFDLNKKANEKIQKLEEELKDVTDENERKRIQTSIAKMKEHVKNLKGDVKFEAIYGNRIDEMLKKKLESDKSTNAVEIENEKQQKKEAEKRLEEVRNNPKATEEEKETAEREVRKHEVKLVALTRKREKLETNDIDKAYGEGEILQARRSYKKNLIRNSLTDAKTQVSESVKKMKKLDPNSAEYIEESRKIDRIRREIKLSFVEMGESQEAIKELMDTYSFVKGNEIIDVLYASALNKVRSLSNTGILIEEQGHTVNKEAVYRLEENKKFSRFIVEKAKELSKSGMSVDDIKSLNDAIFEAMGNSSSKYSKDDTDFKLDTVDLPKEQKDAVSAILNEYLENEPDPEKRKVIVRRLSYEPNQFAMKRYVEYGIERHINEKTAQKIKDEEIETYFNGSKENLIVNDIIRRGNIESIVEDFMTAQKSIEESKVESKSEKKPEEKPQTKKKNVKDMLKNLTSKVKESEAIKSFSQLKAKFTRPKTNSQDISQDENEQNQEEAK